MVHVPMTHVQSGPPHEGKLGNKQHKSKCTFYVLMFFAVFAFLLTIVVFVSCDVISTSFIEHISDLYSGVNRRKREVGPPPCTTPSRVCLTESCVHASSQMLTATNRSVDPCHDFYNYACGGWIYDHEHKIGMEHMYYAANFNEMPEIIDRDLQELMKKRRKVSDEFYKSRPYQHMFNFYESCLHVEAIESTGHDTIIEALKNLQEFHFGRAFNRSSWNVTAALLEMMRLNGVPLLDVSLDADIQTKHRWALVVNTPRRYGLLPSLFRHHGESGRKNLIKQLRRAAASRRLSGGGGGAGDVTASGGGGTNGLHVNKVNITEDLPKNNRFMYHDSTIPVSNLTEPSDGGSGDGGDGGGGGDGGVGGVGVGGGGGGSSDNSNSGGSGSGGGSDGGVGVGGGGGGSSDNSNSGGSGSGGGGGDGGVGVGGGGGGSSDNSNSSSDSDNMDLLDYFARDYKGPLPPWLEALINRPVDRRDMYAVLERTIAQTRRLELSTNLQDMISKCEGAAEFFMSGTYTNITLGSRTLRAYYFFDHIETVEDGVNYLLNNFIDTLDKILPSKREELLVTQRGELYNLYTVQELQNSFPAIEWSYLLGELLGAPVINETIYVYHPAYLHALSNLILASDAWLVHWGMVALFLQDVISELIHPGDPHDREDFCLQTTKTAFGTVLSHLYLHHLQPTAVPHARAQVATLLTEAKKTFAESIEAAPWLTPADKTHAMQKLQHLQASVGALDKHMDINYVNSSYEDLQLVVTKDDFVGNVLHLYRTFRANIYKLYQEPLDNDVLIWELTVNPFVVNAFHMQAPNTIVFPVAFFWPPFHYRGAPTSVLYGATGTAVSHELFHAFDVTGIQFDHDGMAGQHYTPAAARHLTEAADCYHRRLIAVFQSVVHLQMNKVLMTIDSNATINENLADMFALRNAFWSYRRAAAAEPDLPTHLPAAHLTSDQLFFLAAAQPYCAVLPPMAKLFLMELDEHLPNDIRVNAMMLNTPEFSLAFHCPPTSRMSTPDHCDVFPMTTGSLDHTTGSHNLDHTMNNDLTHRHT